MAMGATMRLLIIFWRSSGYRRRVRPVELQVHSSMRGFSRVQSGSVGLDFCNNDVYTQQVKSLEHVFKQDAGAGVVKCSQLDCMFMRSGLRGGEKNRPPCSTLEQLFAPVSLSGSILATKWSSVAASTLIS